MDIDGGHHEVGKGALSPIIPTTQSPFTKMMSCPNDVIIYHLQEVFDRKMYIAGLNNAADNYKAFAIVQEMIRFVLSAQLNQPCSQEVLDETYPFLIQQVRPPVCALCQDAAKKVKKM